MSIDELVERVRAESDVQKAFAEVAIRVALDQVGTGLESALQVGDGFMACVASNDTNRGESAARLIREILTAADRTQA